jgi:Spy/CpxP family protein refolding chaperone
MSKKNNVAAINHVTLQQIRNDKKTMSITAIAKKYGVGYAAAKNATESKSLSEFRRRMASYNANEAKANQERRKAKKQNTKAQVKAAEKITAPVYTPEQATAHINSLLQHVGNLEDRVQTISSLLVESDDNVVTRLYRLENKRGLVRRFLERF